MKKKQNRKSGRPQESKYERSLVKTANERLRKIEKVYGLTEDSNEYRIVSKYAIEYPKTKGKIYRLLDEDGNRTNDPRKAVSIRFINKTEYEKLSVKEQRYFNEVLDKFLNASTTTKAGIESKYEKGYTTFMQNYGDKYKDMSINQYKDFFKIYRDMVNKDKKSHFDYNTLVQTLEYIDISTAMTDNQITQVMKYISTDRWNKIPRKYRLSNK